MGHCHGEMMGFYGEMHRNAGKMPIFFQWNGVFTWSSVFFLNAPCFRLES